MVGVVVDVAEPVRGHEGMARDVRGADRLGRAGDAGELRRAAGGWRVLEDRDRRQPRDLRRAAAGAASDAASSDAPPADARMRASSCEPTCVRRRGRSSRWKNHASRPMDSAQKPLELILARNLITSLSTPAFLVGRGRGAAVLQRGRRRAAGDVVRGVGPDAGPRSGSRRSGPSTSDGEPIPLEELAADRGAARRAPRSRRLPHPLGEGRRARRSRPARCRSSADAGSSGAMIFFWPVGDAQAPRRAGGRLAR